MKRIIILLTLLFAFSAHAQDPTVIHVPVFPANASFNTANIQNAIDEAKTNGKIVQLPPGPIRINRTLHVKNAPGIVIRGASPSLQGNSMGTRLEWEGDPYCEDPDHLGEIIPCPMFWVQNSSHYEFADIAAKAHRSFGAFAYTTVDRFAEGEVPTTAGTFRKILVDGVAGGVLHGVWIGAPPHGNPPANDSETLFDRVSFVNFGFGQNDVYANFVPSGIRNDTNDQSKQITVQHSAIGCAGTLGRRDGYGIHNVGGGTMTWDGDSGGIFNCRIAFVWEKNIGGRNMIRGGDFEGNRGFLQVSDSSNIAYQQNTFQVEDVRIARNEMSPGDVHISLFGNGPFRFEGIGIDPSPVAAEVAFRWQTNDTQTLDGPVSSPASLTIVDSTIGTQLDDVDAMQLNLGTHSDRVIDVSNVVMVKGDGPQDRHWYGDPGVGTTTAPPLIFWAIFVVLVFVVLLIIWWPRDTRSGE